MKLVLLLSILSFLGACSPRVQRILLKPGENVTITTPLIHYEISAEEKDSKLVPIREVLEELRTPGGKFEVNK